MIWALLETAGPFSLESKLMPFPGLTIFNEYTLMGTPEAFCAAVTALAARVEVEGHLGVSSYRFFVSDDGLARAVIDYDSPAAWIGHHDIAMGWPEMQALHAVATLSDVTFLGPLTDEIAGWLEQSGLKAQIHRGFRTAAGFQRA
jgi:hypothetical protein